MTLNEQADNHDNHAALFTLASDSAASSRSSSPAPSISDIQNVQGNGTRSHLYITDSAIFLEPKKEEQPPGRKAGDVYDTTLAWWRAALRKRLVEIVRRESEVIARMQDRIRTPWLDAYFVYTSTLGTHTFFMIFLPAFFFFGYDDAGRGLLMVLAFGVWASSFVKDLFCSPRPFAPPVTRLTIGSHHLEYGFPSTHSTNSVSIALFLWSQIYVLATDSVISPTAYLSLTVLLVFYAFSIVFGRLYTAMHSFSDCIMGVLLGTTIWWVLSSFPGIPISSSSATEPISLFKGLGWGEILSNWARNGGWGVPLTIIPLGLLAVNQHPQPVDDCPCFEDAIAFMSVAAGALLGSWGVSHILSAYQTHQILMAGSGFVFSPLLNTYEVVERGWEDVFIWWTVASVKMAIGIVVIVTWRIVAKSALHLILPPLFRSLARVFDLPNRRFYTPATDYKSVPSEFSHEGGLRPIPSVIDLHGELGFEVGGIGSGRREFERGGSGLKGVSEIKVRGRNGFPGNGGVAGGEEGNGIGKMVEDGKVKHYDADVLTKVIVYAGIAVLATEIIPVMFEILGLGVRSTPP